jgi:hypothetical protein
MMKKLLDNKKGTAEVIGSVMFIVILLFFFTSVYLWHDAATKDANQLYSEKINTMVSVKIEGTALNITNIGGADTKISALFAITKGSAGQHDLKHEYKPIENFVISAGNSRLIYPSNYQLPSPQSGMLYKVVTTTGNVAACSSP